LSLLFSKETSIISIKGVGSFLDISSLKSLYAFVIKVIPITTAVAPAIKGFFNSAIFKL
jgi:hypothetical protein